MRDCATARIRFIMGIPRSVALGLWGATTLAACFAASASPSGSGTPVPDAGAQVAAPTGSLVFATTYTFGEAPLNAGQPKNTGYGFTAAIASLRYAPSRVTLRTQLGETTSAAAVGAATLSASANDDASTPRVRVDGLEPGAYDTMFVDFAPASPTTKLAAPWFQAEGSFEPDGVPGPGLNASNPTPFDLNLSSRSVAVRLEARLAPPLVVQPNGEAAVGFEIDASRIFAGLQFPSEAVIHDGPIDSAAGRLAANVAKSVRITHNSQRLDTSFGYLAQIEASEQLAKAKNAAPPEVTAFVFAAPDAMHCAEVLGRPASDARPCFVPMRLRPDSTSPLDAGFFSFITKNKTPVQAVSSGVVRSVRQVDHSMISHTDVFTVVIEPAKNSAFAIEYRNITGPAVRAGVQVRASDVIGFAGDYVNADTGMVAFAIYRQQERTQRLCATRFMTPAAQSLYAAALERSRSAWPQTTPDALCEDESLVCTGAACDSPSSFRRASGDWDEGQRIYASSCANCHGARGEGLSATALCSRGLCSCATCASDTQLATRIAVDMPPEGRCEGRCAADVAAFVRCAWGATSP